MCFQTASKPVWCFSDGLFEQQNQHQREGDDGQPQALQLAVSSDMLVAGRHFFEDADPAALGHKALAVNLSDLAAMGAQPLAFTLALALPQADHAWLAAFSQGLLALAGGHGCPLVGGDTKIGRAHV